jgi:TIR domain
MSGIFISYRRSDSAPHAGRLHDRLCDYFGADNVFMDVDDIRPGADFVSLIGEKVASCDALIAVIGKGWLARNEDNGKSRLHDLTDFVRLEVEHALQRDILLIPALVEGAEMPRAEDLPAPLSELSQRQAVELSDKDFQRGVDKIIAALEKFPALRQLRTKNDPREKSTNASTVRRRRSWGAPVAILIVMLFLAWQWSAGQKKETVQPAAENFAGAWEANVTYGWGDSYKEQFRFKPEDSRLFGTASFLGAARAIEDGKIEGDAISFSVRFQNMVGSATTDRKNNYRGKLTGNEIRFNMQDDKGTPPVEFVARKVAGQG